MYLLHLGPAVKASALKAVLKSLAAASKAMDTNLPAKHGGGAKAQTSHEELRQQLMVRSALVLLQHAAFETHAEVHQLILEGMQGEQEWLENTNAATSLCIVRMQLAAISLDGCETRMLLCSQPC